MIYCPCAERNDEGEHDPVGKTTTKEKTGFKKESPCYMKAISKVSHGNVLFLNNIIQKTIRSQRSDSFKKTI